MSNPLARRAAAIFTGLLMSAAAGLAETDPLGEVRVTNRAPEVSALSSAAGLKPALEVTTAGAPLDGLELDQVIRDIYGRFASATGLSGHPIHLAPGPLTTYTPGRFAGVRWLSLFTEPSGWTVETVPFERVAELPSETVVSYRSTWTEVDAAAWFSQDFVKDGSLTLSGALELLRAQHPTRFTGVAAVSSFGVELELEGRSRSYRAAVLWTPLPTGDVLFSLIDHVVPGVDLTFHESRRVVTLEELEFQPAPVTPTLVDKAFCNPGSARFNAPPLATPVLRNRHNSGGHFAELQEQHICRTFSNCRQTCQPGLRVAPLCVDAGDVVGLFVHRTFQAARLSAVDGANGNPAECGYAWGCAIHECLVGFCDNISFGVSGRGASFSISAQGAVLDDLSLSHGARCPITVIPFPSCTTVTIDVRVLPLDQPAPKLQLGGREIRLTRSESSEVIHHGQPLTFVMADWALISYSAGKAEAGDRVRALRASSDDFARDRVEELSELLGSEAFTTKDQPLGEHTALVVAVPPHPMNDRHIPMPAVRLATTPAPVGSGVGRVLVRADFGEDHQLRALDVLHDTLGGVTPELAIEIENALSLERVIQKDHRVVVFATIDVGETLELDQALPYLPKCCDCNPGPPRPGEPTYECP